MRRGVLSPLDNSADTETDYSDHTLVWLQRGKKLMKGMTITNHLLEEAADGSGSEPKRMSRRRKKGERVGGITGERRGVGEATRPPPVTTV